MDDWAWDDPAELRIRLDVALERNAMLAAEIAELRQRLRAVESAPSSSSGGCPASADAVPSVNRPIQNAEPQRVDASAPIETKIALFRSLFAGRDDVYARRWTSSRRGRSGWSPAEADPFDRSLADADRTFFPLTDKVIFDHLSRQQSERDDLHVGLYPMLPDDTTRLLVADFDGKDGSDWRATPRRSSPPADSSTYRCWPRSPGPGPAPTCGRSSPRRSLPPAPARWAWGCCARPWTIELGCRWPATTGCSRSANRR